jgi:transcriptional regulator with XRE-family HTH domain
MRSFFILKQKKMKKEIDLYTSNVMRELRLKNNWSQQKLADQMGISRGFLNDIERITAPDHLNVSHLNLLGEIFGVSPRIFLPEISIPEK